MNKKYIYIGITFFGVILFLIAGFYNDPIFSTIGFILFVLGLHDMNSIYNKSIFTGKETKTSNTAKVVLVVFLIIMMYGFLKFF